MSLDLQDTQRDIQSSRISALSTHQRLLFELIKDAGETWAGELRSRYGEQATSPKT